MTFTHEQFLSPFTWRYGSPAMRAIWSEVNKRRVWRRIWLELARAQQAAGLVTAEQVADLAAHVDQIDIERAEAIEARNPARPDGGSAHLRRAVSGRRRHHPSGRDQRRRRRQRRRDPHRESLDLTLTALRDLLRRFAEQHRTACRPADDGVHAHPARRTDDDGLSAGALRAGFAGRLSHAANGARRICAARASRARSARARPTANCSTAPV